MVHSLGAMGGSNTGDLLGIGEGLSVGNLERDGNLFVGSEEGNPVGLDAGSMLGVDGDGVGNVVGNVVGVEVIIRGGDVGITSVESHVTVSRNAKMVSMLSWLKPSAPSFSMGSII